MLKSDALVEINPLDPQLGCKQCVVQCPKRCTCSIADVGSPGIWIAVGLAQDVCEAFGMYGCNIGGILRKIAPDSGL